MNVHAWPVVAAYLYVLGLDDRGIAWECLRRNLRYRADYAQRERGATAAKWGLLAFEDPAHDARNAEPLWNDADTELLIVPTASVIAAPAFDFWALPAPRRLLHDGRGLCARLGDDAATLRVRLAATLRHGRPFAYQLPAGKAAATLRRRAGVIIRAIETPAPPGGCRPARRDALVRMRTFAALDGHHAGASHRDIAVALFGEDRVRSRWSDDGELRAQIRHLIARGRKLVSGGYRTLIRPGDLTPPS